MPKISEILNVNDEIVFGGAVQVEWFYQKKAKEIAKNFVFHGPDFFGVTEQDVEYKEHSLLDTCTFTNMISDRLYSDQGKSVLMTIAGYGTGKSHLAVTLGKLFENTDETLVKLITNNIKNADNYLGNNIEKTNKKRNLVFILNGMRDFNLNLEILNISKNLLKNYGYDESFFADFTKAYTIAATFVERNYEIYKDKFIEIAEEKNIETFNLKEFLIENIYSDEIFNAINSVYEHVTSTTIRWDEGITAGDILSKLEDKLCGENNEFNKILILFDEFGRYIEFAADRPELAGDSALQQIYESIQSANKNIVFIGFIQSDLKTYLARVKKSANITRYIGRYESGEKIYLSCNLETIFANLILKSDNHLFEEYINGYFNRPEMLKESKHMFDNLNLWSISIGTRGVWNNYEKFSQVILKGIFPFHPLTTLMLTELSDWYQQRSALNFFLNQFKTIQNREISKYGDLPFIRPIDIIKGDFFEELLLAEKEGRQKSENCLLYDRIITKYGDRLEQRSTDVLAAILIYKLLKFRSVDLLALKKSIEYFTGLSIISIDKSLTDLEQDQGLILYDAKRNAFDFVEDALGYSDFRLFIKRVKNRIGNLQIEFLINSEIKEKIGLLTPIETDFSLRNNIKTSEWIFEQDLITAAELNEVFITNLIKAFSNKTAPDKPKGRLIYVYNPENDELARINNLLIKHKIHEYPFVFMNLDDPEMELYDELINERVIKEFSDEDLAKYSRFITNFNVTNFEDLKSTFKKLQERKEFFSPSGIIKVEKRLKQVCTEVFSSIYFKAIPFPFEGFSNKQISIPKKSLCMIGKSILSGMMSYQWMQSQVTEVKNKIDTVLINPNIGWGLLNKDLVFVQPLNKMVRNIFDEMDEQFNLYKVLDFTQLHFKLVAPPFGLNDYSFSLLLSTYIQVKGIEAKIEVDGKITNNIKWSNSLFSDKGVNLEALRSTTLIKINIEGYLEKFQIICNEIEHNSDIKEFIPLEIRLNELLLEMDPPEVFKEKVEACRMRISMGIDKYNRIERKILELKGKFNEGTMKKDYKMVLPTIIESLNLLNDNNQDLVFKMSYEHKETLKNIIENGRAYVKKNYEADLVTYKCQSVSGLGPFKSWLEKQEANLRVLNFNNYADSTRKHLYHILDNMENIKKMQVVIETIDAITKTIKPNRYTSQIELLNWQKKINEHRHYLEENRILSEIDKRKYYESLKNIEDEILKYLQIINEMITNACDLALEMISIEDAKKLRSNILLILEKDIREEDRLVIEPMSYIITDFLIDMKEINEINISQRSEKVQILMDKYSEYEDEVNVINILNEYQIELNEKLINENEKWMNNLGSFDLNKITKWDSQQCYTFIKKSDVVPDYIFEENIVLVTQAREHANKRIHDLKIESILLLFEQLDKDEKQQCLELLLNQKLKI